MKHLLQHLGQSMWSKMCFLSFPVVKKASLTLKTALNIMKTQTGALAQSIRSLVSFREMFIGGPKFLNNIFAYVVTVIKIQSVKL